MRILVTRPQDDAEGTAELLAERRHEAIIAPLLDVKFREGDDISLEGVQAILITSANGVRALATRTARRDIQVLAVGPHSAECARDQGFTNVEHASGDAIALADFVSAQYAPADGALLHAAGADTTGYLVERLATRGFTVKSVVLYDAVAVSALPEVARTALEQHSVDAVLIFSPRSARIFLDLVTQAGLAEECRRLQALCISKAAADALGTLAFQAVRVAPHPNQEELLELLRA
jgi:uroporphyrinogen-III synthase